MKPSDQTPTTKTPYQKTVDSFGKLNLQDKKKAYELMQERLAEEVEQEILRKNGEVADWQTFKDKLK